MTNCVSCGQQISKEQKICPYCGVAQEQRTVLINETNTQQSDYSGQNMQQGYGQPQQGQGAKKPVNGKKIGIIAGIAVALVLAIVFVIKFAGPGAPTQKAALKSYIKAVVNQDVDALIDAYIPKKLWDGIKKEYGISNADIKDDMEYLLSWYDDIDDVRKIKITDKDKANRSEMKDFEDVIKDEFNVKIRISGLVHVKYEYEAKKDGEWEERNGTVILYKIAGKWFIMGAL